MGPRYIRPNIRGALNQNYVGDGNDCIVQIGSTGGVAHYATNGNRYELNASVASSVYSQSSTVQPNSAQSLIIIKV